MSLARPTLETIQQRFGGKISSRDGERYLQMPSPGHSQRDAGTIVRERRDGRGYVVTSFNGDAIAIRDQIHTALGVSPDALPSRSKAEQRRLEREQAREREQRQARQIERVKRIVGESGGLDVGRRYLSGARGLPVSTVALAAAGGSLRDHRDEQGRVSMLALAHDGRGFLHAVQVTKLKADGSGKRGSALDRLTFGPYKGSACRLVAAVDDTLAVAEGVETALAFYALRRTPCWATFGTANLATFDPPRGIRTLIIAADGDTPGLDAAEKLYERARGRIRVIIAAAPDGMDWCDVLNRRGVPCR